MVSYWLSIALLLALATLFIGLLAKLWQWLRTPSHPRHVLTPAPASRLGVAWRLTFEAIAFPSLWRASKVAWLLGWVMHVALLLIAIQHLRYVLAQVSPWLEQVAAVGPYASTAVVMALSGLALRRVLVARVRWVSRPADYLWLLALGFLVLSGVVIKYLMPVDVLAVKAFVRGVITLEFDIVPASIVLLLHMGGAVLVIAVFPFSKMLHGVALLVNPTRASRSQHASRGK